MDNSQGRAPVTRREGARAVLSIGLASISVYWALAYPPETRTGWVLLGLLVFSAIVLLVYSIGSFFGPRARNAVVAGYAALMAILGLAAIAQQPRLGTAEVAPTARASDIEVNRPNDMPPDRNASPSHPSVETTPTKAAAVEAVELSYEPTWVMRDAIDLDTRQLSALDREIETNYDQQARWMAQHKGSLPSGTILRITLRGVRPERVGLVDINVKKTCLGARAETIFLGYTAGGGEPFEMGLDLDESDPQPRDVTQGKAGIELQKSRYFASKTLDISQGELVTIVIGVFTKEQDCSFDLRLMLSSSSGTSEQKVDNSGSPFRIAPNWRSFRGFEKAYKQTPDPDWESSGKISWRKIDPESINKR